MINNTFLFVIWKFAIAMKISCAITFCHFLSC